MPHTRAGTCGTGEALFASTKALLESLIIRLSPSDRPRLRNYCYQLAAATTTLEVVARVT